MGPQGLEPCSGAELVYKLKGLEPTMEHEDEGTFSKLGLISLSVVLLPSVASAKGPGLDHSDDRDDRIVVQCAQTSGA